MLPNIVAAIVVLISCLLFFLWFRSICLLILVAKPSKDYARGVAIANQLAFRAVQDVLCNSAPVDLQTLRAGLDRDFRLLTRLLKHIADVRDNTIEMRMLRIDYRAMRAWCSVTSQVSPLAARRALQEMAMVVAHFASTLGEQLAAARTP